MTLTTNDEDKLAALDRLFKQHYRSLQAYAYRFVNNKEVAEDIVQDVFFELWSRRADIRFDEPEAVKSYLFTSVYHRSLNVLNQRPYKEALSLESGHEEQALDVFLQAYMRNQEHSLLLKELHTEINRFVETLPEQCRRIFKLSRHDELKNKEIADRLGISIKAVEKQITKALRELREHLKKEGLI